MPPPGHHLNYHEVMRHWPALARHFVWLLAACSWAQSQADLAAIRQIRPHAFDPKYILVLLRLMATSFGAALFDGSQVRRFFVDQTSGWILHFVEAIPANHQPVE